MTTALTISSPDTRAVQSLAASIQRVVGDLCNVRSSGGVIYPPVHELSFCPHNQDYLMMIEWAAWRMGRFPVARLLQRDVVLQASTACGYEIRTSKNGRLYWIVKISRSGERGEIAASLPPPAPLCLDDAPVDMAWPVPIGMTTDGELWRDLPTMNHVMIAGETGSGKSTWARSALMTLTTLCEPSQLRLAMIDIKQNQLVHFDNAPHLFCDIALDLPQAAALLSKVVAEMDVRGAEMRKLMITNFDKYAESKSEPPPVLLVYIDEGLGLLDAAGPRSTIADMLKSIAIRGLGTGVFLWLATQHAAAIAGLPRVVNVNLRTRIVFRVADAKAAECAKAPGAERIPPDKPGRCIAAVLGGGEKQCQAWHVDDAQLAELAGQWGAGAPKPAHRLSDAQVRFLRAAVENGGKATGALAADIFGGGDNGREWRRELAKLDNAGVFCERRGASNTRMVNVAALREMGIINGGQINERIQIIRAAAAL